MLVAHMHCVHSVLQMCAQRRERGACGSSYALACSANSLSRASPATRHWNTHPSAPHVSSVVSSGNHQMLRTFAACALHVGHGCDAFCEAALQHCQIAGCPHTCQVAPLARVPIRTCCLRGSYNGHLIMPSGSQV
jgi:hypothetical protein